MSNGVERAMALLRLIIGYLKQAVSRLWNVFKSAAWYIKLPMVLIGIVLAFFVLLLAIDINHSIFLESRLLQSKLIIRHKPRPQKSIVPTENSWENFLAKTGLP